MRRGKKTGLLALVLCLSLGLAGCSPAKEGNKTGSGKEDSNQIQIVYRIVSQEPSEEEIEDTADKLLKRAKTYSKEARVETKETDRIFVILPSSLKADAGELAEELAVPGQLNFVTEDGAVVLDGSDIESAQAREAGNGKSGSEKKDNKSGEEEYLLELKFTENGAKIFSEVTQANIGKSISIVFDGETISSPVVQVAITGGKASITNIDSKNEAEKLASMISIGRLSLELELYEIIEN